MAIFLKYQPCCNKIKQKIAAIKLLFKSVNKITASLKPKWVSVKVPR